MCLQLGLGENIAKPAQKTGFNPLSRLMCLQLTLAVGRDYVPEGKEFQSPFEADVFATLVILLALKRYSPKFQSPFEADVFATLGYNIHPQPAYLVSIPFRG